MPSSQGPWNSLIHTSAFFAKSTIKYFTLFLRYRVFEPTIPGIIDITSICLSVHTSLIFLKIVLPKYRYDFIIFFGTYTEKNECIIRSSPKLLKICFEPSISNMSTLMKPLTRINNFLSGET